MTAAASRTRGCLVTVTAGTGAAEVLSGAGEVDAVVGSERRLVLVVGAVLVLVMMRIHGALCRIFGVW